MRRIGILAILLLSLMLFMNGCGQPSAPPEAGEETPIGEEEGQEEVPAEEEPADETAAGEWTGSLVIAKSDEPNSIDPHVHDGWYSVRAHSAVYETLVDMVWNPDTEQIDLMPLLATDWEVSDDGLVYTFNLQEGVQFHDGTPFTSESVKATFERNQALGMRASWQVAPIETIETPDELTVVITLNRPFTPFLLAMGRAYIMNHNLVAENDEGDNAQAYFNQNMNGTGPYKFVRWDRESIIEFEANQDYWRGWDGKHFERIILRHVPDPATQRLLMEQNEVDFALQISPEDAQALQGSEGIEVFDAPTTSTFDFPLKLKGALEEREVRQALAYSFPYDAAIEGIRGGFGQRIYGPFPEGVAGYTEEGLIQYDYDPDRAAQMLEDAGWTDTDGDGIRDKDGEPLELELWTIAALTFEAETALLWEAALAEIGVGLNVVEQSAIASFVTATYDFDAPANAFGWVISLFIPDAHDVARQYHTSSWEGLNTSFYGNEETDALIDEASQMPDGPERTALYEELQRIINEDAPHIWIWQERKIVVRGDDIQGYVYNPVDYIREFNYYDMYRE